MSSTITGCLSNCVCQEVTLNFGIKMSMDDADIRDHIMNCQDAIKIEKVPDCCRDCFCFTEEDTDDAARNDAMNYLNTCKSKDRQAPCCRIEKITVQDSTYKDDCIIDTVCKCVKKSTKNGKHYPTTETKREWLSVVLDNTDHEAGVKEGIEKKSGFVPNLPSLYRRHLDDEHCVSLNTEFGRRLLASTLYKGKYANIYYTLSQQFHTQADSMQCGPSSLVYVLNSLNVDPGRQWKYPWRWYDEEMLVRCTPPEYTQACGCSFDMMVCMAKNNGVCVDVVRASQDWTEEDFRNDVKRSCESFDQPLLMSFSRKTLKQIGSGHFSPIGAYNEEHDMVLVMEIARFKYPPFWTKLSKMWEALQAIAVSGDMKITAGMPRGYLMVRKAKDGESTAPRLRLPWQQAVFQIKSLTNDDNLIHTIYLMKKSKKLWMEWLQEQAEAQTKEGNGILVKAVDKIIEISKGLDPPVHQVERNSSLQMLRRFTLPGVERTDAFKVIKQRLQQVPIGIEYLKGIMLQMFDLVKIPGQEIPTIPDASEHDTENGHAKYNGNHVSDFQDELNEVSEILTTMILFWPYDIQMSDAENTSNVFHIQAAIEPEMSNFPNTRRTSIAEQLNTIFKLIDHAGHEVIYGEQTLDV